MGITAMDRRFRHIVDVDGMLLGIEQAAIETAQLLRRAGLPEGCRLVRLSGKQFIAMPAGYQIQLCEVEVPFFQSIPANGSVAEAVAA